MPRTYVDNAYNRRVGRVGLPVGSAVISKNTFCGINTKTYVDNDYNRRLGRVGLPHGSAVVSKYSDGLTTWNYLNTDKQEGRQECPQRVISSPTPKFTEFSSRGLEHALERPNKHDTHLTGNSPSNLKEESLRNGSNSGRKNEIDQYKHEIEQLKLKVQELKDDLDRRRSRSKELQQEIKKINKKCDDHNIELDKLQRSIVPEKERWISQLENQLEKKADDLAKAQEENSRLKEEVQNLKMYEQICSDQGRQLEEYRNKILPEKEHAIAELHSHIVNISNYLQEKENETMRLREHVEYLEQYEHLCYDLQYQLQDLQENIVPQKEQTIVELQRHVEELIGEKNTLKHMYVPVSHLEVLPETNLGKAIQQLQQYYDRDYRSRFDITDKMEVLLQTRIESVMGELCQNRDIGGQLAKVIATYTSLVLENSNLHRLLKTKQDELQQMKTELRQTKARKSETMQRMSYQTEE